MIRLARHITAVAATGVLGLGTAVASTVGIGTTGPGSYNTVRLSDSVRYSNTANNNVGVHNSNYQNGSSGGAYVIGNTIGGNASSGNVWNNNSTGTNVNISNGGSGSGWYGWMPSNVSASLGLTGPHSYNAISVDGCLSYVNSVSNWVNVGNSNNQYGTSGSAWNAGNTYGGNASTGWVGNNNNTSTNVALANGGSNAGSFTWTPSNSNVSFYVTGPNSYNSANLSNSASYTSTTNNNVGVNNSNVQSANSGSAAVVGNTIGGSATTGAVSNNNVTNTGVSIENAAGTFNTGSFIGGGTTTATIGITGPNSYNAINVSNDTNVRESTSNTVNVSNTSNQQGNSGSATVSGNTIGGNAMSGSVGNSNTTTTGVSL